MAGTEGVGELYTGWSYVVHRPSDEPEPTDLPSTVDMAAFSSELNTTPADNAQAEESSDSDSDSDSDTNKSGSDESESSDQSDSSNSDSSSSSQDSNSRAPTPEFSVTSSQTNSLRLTISKACVSPTEKKPSEVVVKPAPQKGARSSGSESDDSDSGKSDASKTGRKDVKECVRRQVRRLRARAPVEAVPPKRGVVRKDVPVVGGNKGPAKKGKNKRNPKMASLPISRGSTYSSDSENSDNETNMVNYDVLQEINQEDLAAILPDQQEIDSYVFDKNNPTNAIPPKETFNDPEIIEDGSGSDMELHQQAVNALIQRTTSESENESQDLPPNSLYSNSLLQQFEVQTQMLNTSAAAPNIDGVAIQNSVVEIQNKDLEKDQTKRKRGRPRKAQKSSAKTEFSGDPNVSPDSGIQNSPDHVSSPEASPIPSKAKIIEKKTVKIPEKIVKNNLTTKLKEQNKLPVTCNKFDRLLYGNTDRVLYPPRRKAGRPPVVHKKGPGRPPKHKTNDAKHDEKSEVKSQKKKLIKTKTTPMINSTICTTNTEKTKEFKKPGKETRFKKPQKVISSKTKPELRLKYAKLMHSKHKHRKHKKCKFKILKPITTTPDPKITAEIEKLVQDFVKLCNITSKENMPEVIKALKKSSKKRKTSEYSDRKKKKQTAAAISKETSNEQRLPLKKRHYHLNAESKDETETKTNEDKNDKKLKENKLPVVEKKIEEHNLKTVASPRNNNEYEVDTHIDEAIEACITKYSKDGKVKQETSPKTSPKIEEKKEISVGAITTPKKRHLLEIANNLESLKAAKTNLLDTLKSDELKKNNKSLENVVTEIKLKRLSPKISEAQMITRKKNRLEDLTSTLVSKIAPTGEENKRKLKEEGSSRVSVIKYPVCKKAKPAENEKLDSVVEEKPTGIFTPTVDLEIHLPSDIKTENAEIKVETKVDPIVEAKKESKRKIRKRRAINRTGFPTVKKKKKKIIETPEIEKPITCDRVPKEGEEYSTFLQRSQSLCETPVEKIEEDNVMKWESISECDSLPQDERIEFDLEVRSDKKRDISPSSSVGTRSSGTLKKRREYTPDCPTDDDVILEARLRRVGRKRGLRELHRKAKDKRLRDVSPASSVEPSVEKRLREERASASGDEKKNKKAPRWRKKHLVAGLFSDYYKEDDETARQKRAEAATTKARLVYNPADHPFGLLPAPYHCGKYLRCRKIPFQLPHDLWWQHTHSQLPGRDIVPSWNYRKIRTNVYNVKLTTGACEPQSCNCKDSNCGDDCINRLVLAECPTTHKCPNQKIQKHEWSPGLEKFMTDSKGWGVRTNLPIKSGEFILEYVGEVVSDQEFKERMASRYAHDTHHYCLHLDGGLVIDGHRMGGDGRFVNHSCSPNCEMQKWSVNGQFRMALFSLRSINSGEELTYDYNFSLFNPADGQECKCGSDVCRGVIGGKSQRVKRAEVEKAGNGGNGSGNGSSGSVGSGVGGGGRVGRPRKNQAKKAPACPKENGAHAGPVPVATVQQQAQLPALRPLSNTQRAYVQEHRVFLLRNLYKVRRSKGGAPAPVVRAQTATPTEQTATNANTTNSSSTTFVNHINALRQPRNMKTRRLAQAEDDPELQKTAKLATFLQDLYNIIAKTKDEKNGQLCAPFITLPTKRKQPNYYQKISDPIDLNMIEQNIASGVYKTAESFDLDMSRLFANAIKFYGRTSELGIAATRLKKIYVEAKQQNVNKFFDEIGEKPPSNFLVGKNKGEEEDVIRCICGMFRDEGLMIQCERCLVWQHCECVRADEQAPSYHCERCVPRKVDFEISMDEFTEHGHRYYMTLLRGDLQLRQGDTVYVLRDIPIPGTNKKHTYDTIGTIKYADLDIFRIERLWKDSKTGQRLAYGHHYLRPHETYHEPTRKFFPNEVMRVPLYEAVPVELIMEHCWVMDLNTYCKGRPMGAPSEHIYICEYRVDKTARLFSKVSKSKFPMCTKSYAFERFDTRLKISRTYTPHDLDTVPVKPRGRKPQEVEEEALPQQPAARHRGDVQQVAVQIPVVKTRAEKQIRLNKILLNLLGKLPTKQPLDVSYLLEGGRRRKKTT